MNDGAMTHEQAVKTEAAIRYLLKEMHDEECSAFEEHFVDCKECSDQVQAGLGLAAASRELPAFRTSGFFAALRASFRQPAFSFALALLALTAGFIVYQQTIISELKAPGPESRYVLTGIAHGAGDANLIRVARNSILSLTVEYRPDGEFVSYQMQMSEASGKVKHLVPLPASQTGDKATIAVPAGALAAGSYTMVVQGRTSDGTVKELGHGTFELQFLD
jgi:hypothetical protein